ncbi:hypothetical protein FZEAL_1761 [Fusarium zealandicum]|uniref:Uncharacterized protein n=1 Tax=Fusarium zealandicum TaxID=1053134 RepID=A0A8H4USU7_9HYPO|nr:hypothetical protein FZEAL_1761 [Fusarium zealandicum]
MLSVKHHACCWAASITTAVTYRGLEASFGYNTTVFRLFLAPLLAYALYLIGAGPRRRPKWWTPYHFTAVACLMVFLGAVSDAFIVLGSNNTRIKGVLHTLLAFSALGALESIRLNHKDFEPAHVLTILMGPRVRVYRPYFSYASLVYHLYTHSAFIFIFGTIIAAINSALCEASCTGILDIRIKSTGSHLGNAALLYFVIGPLVDTAETASRSIVDTRTKTASRAK